jgi:hypothetical protein
MTDAELDDLQALSDAATPWPWEVTEANDKSWWVWCFSILVADVGDREADARFIVAARKAIPELIREVKRLRQATE